MTGAPSRLIVFDVDGTLLLNGRIAADTFVESFEAVTGRPPAAETPRFQGRTDRAIYRSLLGDAVGVCAFEEGFGRFAETFRERLAERYPRVEGPRLLPGVRALIEALHAHPQAALALGTGNLRPVAYLKLARFGLDRFFPAGGFGGEHEERSAVVEAAFVEAERHYRCTFPRAAGWVVGDTVHDVNAAHAVGCRALAVQTGAKDPGDLDGADVVMPDLRDTRAVLACLLGGCE